MRVNHLPLISISDPAPYLVLNRSTDIVKTPAPAKKVREETEKERLDRLLDEALEQSFPASDPPSHLRGA